MPERDDPPTTVAATLMVDIMGIHTMEPDHFTASVWAARAERQGLVATALRGLSP